MCTTQYVGLQLSSRGNATVYRCFLPTVEQRTNSVLQIGNKTKAYASPKLLQFLDFNTPHNLLYGIEHFLTLTEETSCGLHPVRRQD